MAYRLLPFKYLQLVRALGLRWTLFRVRYAWRVKHGALRRATPMAGWDTVPGEFDNPFSATGWVSRWARPSLPEEMHAAVLAEAREILAGRFCLFGFHHYDTGVVPDWYKSPFDGKTAPADRHWSMLGDFGFGDIKNIWELSRWSWAFTLARAWHVSQNDSHAARFWELLEDWMDKNPPNRGVNWKCGQETSFRLFAAVFARMVLDQAPSTTPARLAQWRRLVRVSGQRIAANLDYALSQSNNHGISECVGLMTAGALVGDVVGQGWFARGEQALRKQLATLVYPDGGFSQHSAVYHRVLLHDLLWATRVYDLENKTAPDWLRDAGARATRFLGALVDAETGRAHLYGANDGSNILPVSSGGYDDFRPAVQAGAGAFLGKRWFETGAWDEAADWLALISGETDDWALSDKTEAHIHFSDAGVLVWKKKNLSLLLRCPREFRHRPSKADLLHLSVHWRGRPVLLNPGSFSYNATGHFSEGFSSAFVHNTATVDGTDQMEKFSRFLYLPWPRGRAEWKENGTFEAEHFSYQKQFGATHTRRVSMHEDGTGFTVEDQFESTAPRRWRLHWLLVDGELNDIADGTGMRLKTAHMQCHVRWESPVQVTVSRVRSDEKTVRGWHAPYYQHAEPAHSIALELAPMASGVVRTVFSLDSSHETLD